VATARLKLDNWTGKRLTDLFSLLKVYGKCVILKQGVAYMLDLLFHIQKLIQAGVIPLYF
jgi:hypothetical protein